MLKKFVIITLISLSISLSETDTKKEKFVLPDIFVTAKDQSKFDEAARSKLNYKTDYTPVFNTSLIKKELTAIALDRPAIKNEKINYPKIFNRAGIYLGNKSIFGYDLYHGYYYDQKSYFLALRRMTNFFEYEGIQKNRNNFFGTIYLNEKTQLSLNWLNLKLAGAENMLISAALDSSWNLPFFYEIKFLNTNSYAGNKATSYLSNYLNLDIGEIIILKTKFQANTMTHFIGSNYSDIGINLNRDYNFNDIKSKVNFGVNRWANKSESKVNLSFKNEFNININKNKKVKANIEFTNDKPNIASYLNQDFMEWNDIDLYPEEKMVLGLESINLFGYQESLGLSYKNYARKIIYKDSDNDNFYEKKCENNASVITLKGQIMDLNVLTENFDVKIEVPFYNHALPNQFTKGLSIIHKKNLYQGLLESELMYILADDSIEGFIDAKLHYSYKWNKDITCMIEIGNILSSGKKRYKGYKIGGLYLLLNLDVLF